MMMHFHDWGQWLDVDKCDEVKFSLGYPFPYRREVIVQQKRCSICNLVKTRRA